MDTWTDIVGVRHTVLFDILFMVMGCLYAKHWHPRISLRSYRIVWNSGRLLLSYLRWPRDTCILELCLSELIFVGVVWKDLGDWIDAWVDRRKPKAWTWPLKDQLTIVGRRLGCGHRHAAWIISRTRVTMVTGKWPLQFTFLFQLVLGKRRLASRILESNLV